ncbi:MAG: NAD-dependent epimerase/dehydratase family protein [Steroidobacteraceae bacterium]
MASDRRIRLLVVGGTGFIGRHVVSRGVALGWEVTSLSLRSPAESMPRGVQVVLADTADAAALRRGFRQTEFEYVVNCGGYIDHTLFFSGGCQVFEGHMRSVLNLVEILDRRVLQAFVNIGSSDEYGGNSAPQVETQREMPIAPYSAGKVAITHLLQMLHRTDGFPATTLRAFLVYGPGQDRRRFLPQIIVGCLEDRRFPTSKGDQLRDFCFVRDVVDGIFATLGTPSASGEVINIASGAPVSIRVIIETVQRLIGRGDPQFGRIAYRPGENMELYADVSKASAILGWAPRVTMEMGLDETIQWIRMRL